MIRNGSVLLSVWVLYYFTPDDFIIPVSVVVTGFIIGHFISVFENLSKMGVKIPKMITDRLKDVNNNDNDRKVE